MSLWFVYQINFWINSIWCTFRGYYSFLFSLVNLYWEPTRSFIFAKVELIWLHDTVRSKWPRKTLQPRHMDIEWLEPHNQTLVKYLRGKKLMLIVSPPHYGSNMWVVANILFPFTQIQIQCCQDRHKKGLITLSLVKPKTAPFKVLVPLHFARKEHVSWSIPE